jgi:hypothetical protein
MGCDIHMFVEYRDRTEKKNEEYWYSFGGHINPGRDYDLFAALAGVRGGDAKAIFPARGLPTTLGYEAIDSNYLYITDETDMEGTCTFQTAATWIENNGCHYLNENKRHVSNPDHHTHSWLTTEEFAQVLGFVNGVGIEYRALLAAMYVLNQDEYEARVVFWFDN